MSIVYLGIGSNLGNREENCLHSIELLQNRGVSVRKRSSMYETAPWGVENQPPYLNMAIEIETELGPEALLHILQDIESKVGRAKTYRWGPRVLDLDILLFNQLVMNTEELTIPHPYMHQRDFVLRPLNEIAPGVKHPLLQSSISELLKKAESRSS